MILQKQLLSIAGVASRFIGKISSPWSIKKIKGEDYRKFKETMKVGDILMSKTEGELSNLFIPGFFGHSAFVVSDTQIIEATATGVDIKDISEFFFTKDYIVASRSKFMSEEQIDKAIGYLHSQIGRKYDWNFHTSDIKEFYCSELIYLAIEFGTGNSPFKLREILGQPTVSPQDFWDATKLFTRIYRSKSYS